MLERARENRRGWADVYAETRRRMLEEKDRAERPAYSKIVIRQCPHPGAGPSSWLLAEIHRVLGRATPPEVDFEHIPARPFTIPTRDPYIPGVWVNRSGLTNPRAVYTVKRVSAAECDACKWKLFALRSECDDVQWT